MKMIGNNYTAKGHTGELVKGCIIFHFLRLFVINKKRFIFIRIYKYKNYILNCLYTDMTFILRLLLLFLTFFYSFMHIEINNSTLIIKNISRFLQ